MRLSDLAILHWSKKTVNTEPLVRPEESAGSFILDTCQRKIWVGRRQQFSHDVPFLKSQGLECFTGAEAYSFLVRFACGLKSEIIGETDVFGQFKEAWKKFIETGSPLVSKLSPWIQRVFEDTKEIRSRHLQNLGGHSYGSLVRSLLNDESDSRVLLIGAGQLAASVLPWLLNHRVYLYNRTPERCDELLAEVKSVGTGSVQVLRSKAEELEAWKNVQHVVICVPPSTSEDTARAEAFRGQGKVVHLGGNRKDLEGMVSELQDGQLIALDDVFRAMKERGDVRLVQVYQAERACDERAKLRALGGSLSIPHGWEDLAVFA